MQKLTYVAMDYKLTLNINKTLAEKAKVYARSQGRSLSDLVENYFQMITEDKVDPEMHLSNKLKSLKGSITLPADFDYKKELSDRISERHQK